MSRPGGSARDHAHGLICPRRAGDIAACADLVREAHTLDRYQLSGGRAILAVGIGATGLADTGEVTAQAGCTWWLETRWTATDSVQVMRDRLAAGPPRA